MATFDRFDICAAWYVYASLWHSGAASAEYAIFGQLHRIKYEPSSFDVDITTMSDNAREIYADLVQRNHPERCGYNPCACRDCIGIAVGVPDVAMCSDCQRAECSYDSECKASEPEEDRRSVFTGWRTVTPGKCSDCGSDDEWNCDGRGTVYCDCQRCPECGSFDGHDAGCAEVSE